MYGHMTIEEFLESSNQHSLEQISQGYIDDNEWDKGSHYIVLRELSKKLLTEVQKEKDLLENVWYAVEWYCSGDTGLEAVKKAVKYYKEDQAEKQPKTPLQLMQNRELEAKIYKHAVREFVDEETYQKISDLYNQKITEARSLGLNKTNLKDLFPDKER